MELLVQTAGSLIAIIALAGLAWWMKLGGAPLLDGEDAVRRAAGEVEDGFTSIAAACDAEGKSALARDSAGRIMVIKRHGNRFAGRVLGPGGQARVSDGKLVVAPGEARFGEVVLTISDAPAWADAINRVNGPLDA
jgi:hypothetical protein